MYVGAYGTAAFGMVFDDTIISYPDIVPQVVIIHAGEDIQISKKRGRRTGLSPQVIVKHRSEEIVIYRGDQNG